MARRSAASHHAAVGTPPPLAGEGDRRQAVEGVPRAQCRCRDHHSRTRLPSPPRFAWSPSPVNGRGTTAAHPQSKLIPALQNLPYLPPHHPARAACRRTVAGVSRVGVLPLPQVPRPLRQGERPLERYSSKNRHPETASVSCFYYLRGESRLGVRSFFGNRDPGGAFACPTNVHPEYPCPPGAPLVFRPQPP
jgi:hypothetical protein